MLRTKIIATLGPAVSEEEKMIKIKKGEWEIKSNFLFYDQFQRFKKAMEKIERPYEIIWP